MSIIDRTRDLQGSGKSLENRQRFLRRLRGKIRAEVNKAARDATIKDLASGNLHITVNGGVEEPSFALGRTGVQDLIFPGNRTYEEGDFISRGGGGGSGNSGGNSDAEAQPGDTLDRFKFVLKPAEILRLLFDDDLELPQLTIKPGAPSVECRRRHRAGYSTNGTPARMAIFRSVRQKLMRNVARKGEINRLIEALEAELRDCTDKERRAEIERQLEMLRHKLGGPCGFDPTDIRYRQYDRQPTPVTQAVMFCLMDVSGSMNDRMKSLARRFYTLLYWFLKTSYSRVEIVFVQHTENAQEVDEKTFFGSPESGGTRVSAGVELVLEIIKERFSPVDWNIFVAQASDGDNSSSDEESIEKLLVGHLLPMAQFYAYVEVDQNSNVDSGDSLLWRQLLKVASKFPASLAMRKLRSYQEVRPTFNELFRRRVPAK